MKANKAKISCYDVDNDHYIKVLLNKGNVVSYVYNSYGLITNRLIGNAEALVKKYRENQVAFNGDRFVDDSIIPNRMSLQASLTARILIKDFSL